MKAMRMGSPDRAQAILEWLPPHPVIGVEVGVHAGELSAMLLTHPGLRLIMVDPWAPFAFGETQLTQEDQDWLSLEAARVTGFAVDRRVIVRMPSVEAATYMRESILDFVFLDADHTYESVRADIALWLPHVKPGGFIAGHDYNRATPGVAQAVHEAFGPNVDLAADTVWRVRL